MATTDPTIATSGSIVVPLAKVESELTRQLKKLQGAGDQPVQRARMSNLIIFCDTTENAAAIDAMVPEITSVHPARVLLLIADDHTGSPDIKATVEVRKTGQGTQLYSEHVTLSGGSRMTEHLPFAVRELLIGDLPTNLWWTSNTPPPFAAGVLDDLAETAQQVIFDSLGWLDPIRGVAAASNWLTRFERDGGEGRWRVASDLNWRRLKTWRRLISQTFAPTTTHGALDTISELKIEHGPHAVTQAWQIVGWMASRLGWKIQTSKLRAGVEIALQIVSQHGAFRLTIDRMPDGPSDLRRVHFACKIDDQPGALDFTADGDARISVETIGTSAATRSVAFQATRIAEIVGRQLTDREPDPVFREAMASAQVLAQAVLR